MAGFRQVGCIGKGSDEESVKDGTMCRQPSPRPGRLQLQGPHNDQTKTPEFILPNVRSLKDDPLEIAKAIDEDYRTYVTAFWHVKFSLPRKFNGRGYFIQRVQRTLKVDRGAERYTGDPRKLVYFEAWALGADGTTPDMEAEKRHAALVNNNQINMRGHDHFGGACYPRTKGTFFQAGQLIFHVGRLPSDFKRNKDGPAGGLLASEREPPFWNANQGVERHLTLTWDLTGDQESWKVSMRAQIAGRNLIRDSREDFSTSFWSKLFGLPD